MLPNLAPPEKLPPLREDLELIPGNLNSAGEETYIVRDIRANRYIRLGADAFKVLAHWKEGVTYPEYLGILEENGVDLTIEELKECLENLNKAQLIETPGDKLTQKIVENNAKKLKNNFDKFIHNYLFFKIPIVYPDKFIKETLIYSDFFFSRLFIIFTLCLAVVCLFFLIPQIDRLRSSFMVSGNLEMAFKFIVALLLSKSVHELSHAFAAARKGCHVGSLGVGFIVGAPVFYADVTDTWRLKDKRDRIIVAAAGVISEVFLAIYASALWLLNVGEFINDVALYLATVTWITTILFNANPLMRFDGYYLLGDFLNIKNLQPRGFALVGQKFREIVFGFPVKKEDHQLTILIYGLASVLYRVTVITGIALLLYHFVFRLLGFFLFAVEIWIFLIKPLKGQFQYAWVNKAQVGAMRAQIGGAVLILLILGVIFIPVDITVTLPGIATREQAVGLFQRYDGQLKFGLLGQPRVVAEKETLAASQNQFLKIDLSVAESEFEMYRRRYERVSVAPQEREFLFSLEAEVEKARAKKKQLEDQLNKINVISPIAGYFLPSNDFSGGQIIQEKAFLGTVLTGKNRAVAFLPEKYLYRVKVGMTALFYNSFDMKGYGGNIIEIEKSAVEKLRFPQMASVYGGPIKAHGAIKDGLYADEAIYRVIVDLNGGDPIKALQMGTVAIAVNKTSLAESFVNVIGRTLFREAHLD